MGGSITGGGQYGQQSGNSVQNFWSKPTYDDSRAQTGLDFLRSMAGGEQQDPSANRLRGFYENLLGTQGGNPQLENMISTTRANAQKGYQDNLAQVRGAGFRGGAARDVINQAGVANDFTNNMAQMEAGLRFQDANQGQSNQFNAASGLQGLWSTDQAQRAAAATALLQALQGNTGQQKGKTNQNAWSTFLEGQYNFGKV